VIAEWIGAAAVLGSILLYPRSVPWGALVGALGCVSWITVASATRLEGLLALNVAILVCHGLNAWKART
jgi:hypothetical protein